MIMVLLQVRNQVRVHLMLEHSIVLTLAKSAAEDFGHKVMSTQGHKRK